MKMRYKVYFVLLAIIWILAFFICLKVGAIEMSWKEFSKALIKGSDEEIVNTIIFNLRLPRLLLAALTGVALSISGLLFQALLKNPLAEPYILGISGGAGAGMMLAFATGISPILFGFSTLPLYSFLGALITIIFVYSFAGGHKNELHVNTLLLVRIALQAILSAFILFIQNILEPIDMARAFAIIMGRIPSLEWAQLSFVFFVTFLGIIPIIPLGRSLNALSLGDENALSVGISVEGMKRLIFLIASLLTGSFVAFTGIIGFVGIIVPHIARLIFGADHRRLIPVSIIGGSLFLMVSDTLARTIFSPTELPVGVLTAIIGGPFFLFLLARDGKKR